VRECNTHDKPASLICQAHKGPGVFFEKSKNTPDAVHAHRPSGRRCLVVLILAWLVGDAASVSHAVAQDAISDRGQYAVDITSPTTRDSNSVSAVAPKGIDRREILLASLTIFVLAVFLGFELINKVPPTLHTPLMSGSNAISGITVVGAIVVAGTGSTGWFIPVLGMLATALATVNAVGGFAVTHRMLAMFRRK
jgi:NAD(P) transhydrogenase subunit alpha